MAPRPRILLERLPSARELSRHERRRLLELLDPVELPAGAVLYEQGSAPEQLALLLSGTLLVTAASCDGEPIPLGRAEPGAVIGEMGVIDGVPRSATVHAERAAVLLVLSRERYAALEAAADPVLVWLLNHAARGMAERIGAVTERIAEAAVDPVALAELPKPGAQRSRGLLGWLDSLRRRA